MDSELCDSFVNDIVHFLWSKLKVQKNQLSDIKIYYNHKTISCIVRVKFDIKIAQELPEDYFYFFVNCYQSDITIYGQKLQDSLSDNENYITWINENKVLKFYPENRITNILSSKL
jgi:hypothetical protein